MTVRRAWVLIRTLPPGSLLMRVLAAELAAERKAAEEAEFTAKYRAAEARYAR